MNVAKGMLLLGAVGLVAACGRTMPGDEEPMMVAVVCSTELLDSTGVVASIEDTVNVTASRDTVGTDPRPCISSYNKSTRTLMLNAKSAADTVGGDPRD